ncbi:eukaryotic translation initiation factor 2D isoform X1 [Ornithorhynchus anatinus]|uniref:Eukaryotic translation initiation factor 2D n=2 Tax=Ornithorhynchus anatinus TaxID=9258 RepID=F6UHL1_ORNAN|nr:eukaryotic translation initiation factor 2D isoform X1 [Ornithorhynchus anatinus]
MFAKAFRLKSNTAIKGSDRRKLRADVTAAFSAPGISELVPSKDDLNVVKLYAHKGDAVTVYVRGGNPILFELEKNLYPTVYTLWSYPDLLPAFTTWPPVLAKLAGGADLMLPGLVVPPCGLPRVQQGDLCAINLVGSRAPVAVAVAAMSTAEMLASGMKGRGLTVLHTYLDHLWRSGDKSSPPSISPLGPEPSGTRSGDEEEPVQGDPTQQVDLESLSLTGSSENGGIVRREAEEKAPKEGLEEVDSGGAEERTGSLGPQEQMDALLHRCFLRALKSRVKKADLPLLTSTFLGSHMFSCCPEGQQLDIKKSSYKKLSKFLQHMQQQQVVQVKELSRGVESIVAVDWKHPSIASFHEADPSPDGPSPQECEGEQPYHPPDIEPAYCIPANMSPLFQESGHKKGSFLSAGEARAACIDYVKRNQLVDEDNKNLVKIDPILCDCLLEKVERNSVLKLPWDNLLSRCLERLQPAYRVTFYGQEPVMKKGKISPIEITLAQRASNKKVTLIRNLEVYGLDPYSVANILQLRGQASATLCPVPGTKDTVQVQIQGNQINHLSRLLLDEYHIPRKYVQGLEKAPKAGKKK